MSVRRKNDGTNSHSWYRTDRVVKDKNNWYFLTREGTVEGPFECEEDAYDQLEVYIRLAVNDLLLEDYKLALEN